MEVAPQAGVLAQIVYDYEFWKGDQENRGNITSASVARTWPRSPLRVPSRHAQRDRHDSDCDDSGGAARRRVRQSTLPSKGASEWSCSLFDSRSEGPPDDLRRRADDPRRDARRARRVFRPIIQSSNPGRNHQSRSGLQRRIARPYNRASVFLLSSRYEGWGLPAAEAMACGAAVVATRCGGVEDFVHDERNGLLAPVADPRTLADATLRLLRDESTRVR